MRALALTLLLVASALAQLPDAPIPSASPKFFDRTTKLALAGSAAIFTADAVATCRFLAINRYYVQGNTLYHTVGEEFWLPVHTCAGVSLWMAGSFALQSGTAFLLHRWHHRRLERIVEFGGASGSIAGLAYSHR